MLRAAQEIEIARVLRGAWSTEDAEAVQRAARCRLRLSAPRPPGLFLMVHAW